MTRIEQWELFKKGAMTGQADRVNRPLIIDSPCMSGFLGISHLDYYSDPEVWFNANLKILKELPDVIVFSFLVGRIRCSD